MPVFCRRGSAFHFWGANRGAHTQMGHLTHIHVSDLASSCFSLSEEIL